MPNDHHRAVIVGIDHYPDIGNLQCARRDAEAFKKWLLDATGGDVPEANIETILADLPAGTKARYATPKTEDIHYAIRDAFEKADAAAKIDALTWGKSRLYLFFAGHGVAPKAKDAALLAANAEKSMLGFHVSCDALSSFFQEDRHFQEVVIFADCCRDDVSSKVDPAFPPWNYNGNVGGESARVLFLCGALPSRQAYEEQDGPEIERRGHFTRCLLEALYNRDGGNTTKTGSELKSEVKGLLANLGKEDLKSQAIGVDDDEILFGISTETLSYAAAFQVPAGVNALRLTEMDSLQKLPVGNLAAEVAIRLPMGHYGVELSSDGGATFTPWPQEIRILPGFNRIKLTT